MERRAFIKLGTTAGVGGAAMIGKLPGIAREGGLAAGSTPVVEPLDMKSYLERVDQGLAHIEGWRMEDYLQHENCRSEVDWSSENRLVRDSIKTLYVTGMFGDLPTAERAHPGVQERLWASMDMMDRAVFGTVHHLQTRTPAQNMALRQSLGEKINPGTRLGERLDKDARDLGVSAGRRLQLRRMFMQANFQLGHQDPASVYREYARKVEKLAARHGPAEQLQRRIAAQASEKLFWEKPHDLIALEDQWGGPGSLSGGGRTRPSGTIYRSVSSGGMIMGIGLAAGIVGLLVGEIAGAIVVTVGAILLVVGLIVVIVGVLSGNREPEPPQP